MLLLLPMENHPINPRITLCVNVKGLPHAPPPPYPPATSAFYIFLWRLGFVIFIKFSFYYLTELIYLFLFLSIYRLCYLIKFLYHKNMNNLVFFIFLAAYNIEYDF